ncbi:XTP/dITP diphosphatase [Vibrio rhizosphaerae]|uniref:dITP/XTP pyrophosphatase n=1 Tax=Vibrio rhizosphaerae TaxID=398736 RepID=A0ABU4INK9_9VIBR|nr:XTP/dITP diphosphatase [Vibrio rhizosphaerae]MDW6090991.1 XTP/dITP diphosphatase [Vibrio rhizosphaerae]
MQKIVLATGNAGKVREMSDLLADFGFEVLAQTDLNVSDVAETGTTFIENAIIKARHAAAETGLPAIADDSGLEVDALDGAPGIYSARYAGADATDQQNIEKLLAAMADVTEPQRTARFHCVLVFMKHAADPTPLVCHGVWEGSILRKPDGENGFGYDPVFWVPSEQCASAALPPSRKKQLSHRAQALHQLMQQLTQQSTQASRQKPNEQQSC